MASLSWERYHERATREDLCDNLLRHFPVPGEICQGDSFSKGSSCWWVHLRARCNYLTSLLAMYHRPEVGEPPHVVNGWRTMHKMSPYRVTYGTHNPAMHGLILTHNSVIPNFSWTPRLALEAKAMSTLLQFPIPEDVLVLPAVTGTVVRVFFSDAAWFIATTEMIETVQPGRQPTGALGQQFQACLAQHCKRSPLKYLSHRAVCGATHTLPDLDLRHDRVWFFAMYRRCSCPHGNTAVPYQDPPSLLHLGTCLMLSYEALLFAPYDEFPDLNFSVHSVLAPCVPILPDVSTENPQTGITEGAYNLPELSYAAAYDGLFFVNPVTMFAIRFSTPDVVYLAPLLTHKVDMHTFLAMRIVESNMMDVSRVHMDRMSRRWWGSQVAHFTGWFFGEAHADLIRAVGWHVETMPHWISMWMHHMNALGWDEWNRLDVDIQRLYVLLDYAYEEPHPDNWTRILKHSKYSEWVAKVVVFTMNQAAPPGPIEDAIY